jgi:hypothetical protein
VKLIKSINCGLPVLWPAARVGYRDDVDVIAPYAIHDLYGNRATRSCLLGNRPVLVETAVGMIPNQIDGADHGFVL